ncbi:hypothetical protein NGRA_1054 [Nosema granulosis]|uniref:60S acidic ribosomal protein P1 n=1 Tax=Nosema granulosis TaxID=83296 RepID=A0A9P6H2E5_9MICR|nr:hypothetical protein NGRA_1054 [Nosema granulosis]
MAQSTKTMNEIYPLAALFVYANNMEVTKDKILAVLKALNIEGQGKLAEMFECDVIKMKSMLTSVSSASAPVSVGATQAAATEEKKEEKEEEVEAEEVELDFGDLF